MEKVGFRYYTTELVRPTARGYTHHSPLLAGLLQRSEFPQVLDNMTPRLADARAAIRLDDNIGGAVHRLTQKSIPIPNSNA